MCDRESADVIRLQRVAARRQRKSKRTITLSKMQ